MGASTPPGTPTCGGSEATFHPVGVPSKRSYPRKMRLLSVNPSPGA